MEEESKAPVGTLKVRDFSTEEKTVIRNRLETQNQRRRARHLEKREKIKSEIAKVKNRGKKNPNGK